MWIFWFIVVFWLGTLLGFLAAGLMQKAREEPDWVVQAPRLVKGGARDA
jgi:hypothetical protein